MFSLVISGVLDILQDYLSLDAAQKGFYIKGCKTDVHVCPILGAISLYFIQKAEIQPHATLEITDSSFA